MSSISKSLDNKYPQSKKRLRISLVAFKLFDSNTKFSLSTKTSTLSVPLIDPTSYDSNSGVDSSASNSSKKF